MKNTFYWILMAVILISGISATIYFGLQPRPIPKINLSEFKSDDVVANSILLRLREELRQSSIVLLGTEPEVPEEAQIWERFLANNQEAGLKFDRVVVDQFLKTEGLFAAAEKTDTKENIAQLIQVLSDLQAKGERVAVILPTVYASQLVEGNVAFNLKNPGHLKIMSISFADFPRSREAEKFMRFPCSVEDVDQTGMGRLGCFVTQAARSNYRKKMPHDSLVGMMEQVGGSDYLFLLTKEP